MPSTAEPMQHYQNKCCIERARLHCRAEYRACTLPALRLPRLEHCRCLVSMPALAQDAIVASRALSERAARARAGRAHWLPNCATMSHL